jgi:hypothetical protein
MNSAIQLILENSLEIIKQNTNLVSPLRASRFYSAIASVFEEILNFDDKDTKSNLYYAIVYTLELQEYYAKTYFNATNLTDKKTLQKAIFNKFCITEDIKRTDYKKRRANFIFNKHKKWSDSDLKSFDPNLTVPQTAIIGNPSSWVGNGIDSQAVNWKSWNTNRQFFIAPPPLTQNNNPTEYFAQLNYLIKLQPTPAQTQTVLKWSDNLGTPTIAGLWIEIYFDSLRDSSYKGELKIAKQVARLTRNIYDTFIVVWYNKYKYMTERPFQHAARLGILLTITTLTPPSPSYISSHSIVSQVASLTIAEFIPDTNEKMAKLCQEASDSRLYGKIHYQMDCIEGQVMGKRLYKSFLKVANLL